MATSTIATITPITNSQKPLKIRPAITSDAMPIRIVTIQPIGSRPGWSRRPRAPTSAPTRMSHIQCMTVIVPGVVRSETCRLRTREQLGLLRLELLVAEDAVAAKLVELPELVGDVVAGLRPAGARRAEERPELRLPGGRTVRLGPGDRPLLDEAAVADQQQHRCDDRADQDREDAAGVLLRAEDRGRDAAAEERAEDAEQDRHRHRHRIRPRHGPPGEPADDEAGDQHLDDRAEHAGEAIPRGPKAPLARPPAQGHQVASGAAHRSPRRHDYDGPARRYPAGRADNRVLLEDDDGEEEDSEADRRGACASGRDDEDAGGANRVPRGEGARGGSRARPPAKAVAPRPAFPRPPAARGAGP